jgi:hypothetical protein
MKLSIPKINMPIQLRYLTIYLAIVVFINLPKDTLAHIRIWADSF